MPEFKKKQLVVSDMLLFWCSLFKYRFIKIDLITVGKFCFNFSRVLGGVDCVNRELKQDDDDAGDDAR